MSRMTLFSEPFASTGNIAGEGFGNLLGRPSLDMVQTVIREAIQNCIDAAWGGTGPEVLLRVRSLDPGELETLRNEVLVGLPLEGSSRERLEMSLSGPKVRVLEICDFGTTGLGGPLRADAPSGNESPDFVNFVRNVGAPRDTEQGGGTYGYGKTVLYGMSRCATILIDTVTSHGGSHERRFMGCHLGAAFDGEMPDGSKRRFTGRHWWGNCIEDGAVDPLLGDAAEELASRLGLPARNPERTGTSVMILDPRFDPDDELEFLDDQSIGDELIEVLLWNFWPRMIESTEDHRRLSVTLEIEGQRCSVPRPEDFPPLDLFSRALDSIRHDPEGAHPIHCLRPKAMLGRLAIDRGARGERVGPAARRRNSIIPPRSAAIALMRPVELVVRYVEGTPYPDDRFEWAGVFVCSDEPEIEEAFARAEPPAHDDWLPDNLPKGRERTLVKVGLQRLREWASNVASSRSRVGTDLSEGPSLARVSTLLGRMMGESEGQGPARKRSPRGKGRPPGRSGGLSQPVFDRLEIGSESGTCAVFRAELNNRDEQRRIVAEPFLVMDGGGMTRDDLGDDFEVSILDMLLVNEGRRVEGDVMHVQAVEDSLEIRVAMPASAAVRIKLTLEGGES
ncbi:hypothetical protein [Halomonas salifodinae]|uniref:hypothetical protein n=1 Tax=Halomonas salifodinae TaxID=438745 RepID=UPI0033B54F51